MIPWRKALQCLREDGMLDGSPKDKIKAKTDE